MQVEAKDFPTIPAHQIPSKVRTDERDTDEGDAALAATRSNHNDSYAFLPFSFPIAYYSTPAGGEARRCSDKPVG